MALIPGSSEWCGKQERETRPPGLWELPPLQQVKRFARPAAGTEIDASDVRTPSALAAVAAHLVTAVPEAAGGNLTAPYEFVADRLRAVLQDATVQVRTTAALSRWFPSPILPPSPNAQQDTLPPEFIVTLVSTLRYFAAVAVLACLPSAEEAATGSGAPGSTTGTPSPPPDQALNDSRLSDTLAVAWSLAERHGLLMQADGALQSAAAEVLGARLVLAAPDASLTWSVLRRLPPRALSRHPSISALVSMTCAWRAGMWAGVWRGWRALQQADGDPAAATWLCLSHRLLPTTRCGIAADVIAAMPSRLSLPLPAFARIVHPTHPVCPTDTSAVHAYWAARVALQAGGALTREDAAPVSAQHLQRWRAGADPCDAIAWQSCRLQFGVHPASSSGDDELRLAAAITPLRDDPALATALSCARHLHVGDGDAARTVAAASESCAGGPAVASAAVHAALRVHVARAASAVSVP